MSATNEFKNRVYFSQNREDLILESFFPNLKKGFYVDVGANDPLIDSVTKLFYDKGWRGINIEPIKHHHEALQKSRQRDINLKLGVGSEDSSLDFYEYTSGDGLSTFSTEIVQEYERLDDKVHQNPKKYTVKIKTLRDIFSEHEVGKIHFMKVDVEGFEYDVLSSNDWSKYRPEIVCIEANHIIKDWRPLLKKQDYKLVFYDGLNEYYTDTRSQPHKQFDYVDNVVLAKGGGLRQSDYQLISTLEDQNLTNSKDLTNVNLRLQDALASKASIERKYSKLLNDNHSNKARADVAELALRRPLPYVKYQLKRSHRIILRLLTPSKPVDSTDSELQKQQQLTINMEKAKGDELQKSIKELAKFETLRLERINRELNHKPLALRSYLKLISLLKNLKGRS